MCLLLLAHQAHPDYPLIIAANRDEFYERPTAPLAFWEDAPSVLAGRDLRSGGTWLGITQQGRIAAITNFRDPASHQTAAPSRGRLVKDFLEGEESAETYLRRLDAASGNYNGFNLVVGRIRKLFWYSNQGNAIKEISPGIHGLSNHLLNTPWPKVEQGKKGMKQVLNRGQRPLEEALLELLADSSPAPDPLLPDTGVGLETERMLSPIFISSPDYGTRSSTLLFVDDRDGVTVIERTHHPGSTKTSDLRYGFNIA